MPLLCTSPTTAPDGPEGTMTATSQHPVTPTVQQIEAWIAEAIELMATMDLNPKFPKMRKRWLSSVDRIAPARYRRSAKRPLIYDRKQGWEVATAQGKSLMPLSGRSGQECKAEPRTCIEGSLESLWVASPKPVKQSGWPTLKPSLMRSPRTVHLQRHSSQKLTTRRGLSKPSATPALN